MTENLTDIQRRIAHGEEKALAELYQLLYKKLRHFAKALLRSDEVAEEVVEDVLVNLWCKREAILQINNLTVYLYVSVKNRALNILSKKVQELTKAPFDYLDIDINDATLDPYHQLIDAELMIRMQEAVNTLPPRCKMIFKLIREDGLSYKEVSEILNISVNTIDAQMAIAVKRICSALGVVKKAGNTHFISPSQKN